ncbi:MAG: hypothetical protein AB7K09_20200 [Planctomycetota bacterium]
MLRYLSRSLAQLDRGIATWMHRWGHMLHRVALAILFIWFGALKCVGLKTTTSIVAHTVWWGSPDVVLPVLGVVEIVIGLCLMYRRLIRVALLLLLLRLPGTVLALILLPGECFVQVPFAPTPVGQYLLKDLAIFTAAIVIGGTVGTERPAGHHH